MQHTVFMEHTKPENWCPGLDKHSPMLSVQKPERHFSQTIVLGTQQTVAAPQTPAKIFVVWLHSGIDRH